VRMGITGRTLALGPKAASGVYPWDAVQRNSSHAMKVFTCGGRKPSLVLGTYGNPLQEEMLRQTVNFSPVPKKTVEAGM